MPDAAATRAQPSGFMVKARHCVEPLFQGGMAAAPGGPARDCLGVVGRDVARLESLGRIDLGNRRLVQKVHKGRAGVTVLAAQLHPLIGSPGRAGVPRAPLRVHFIHVCDVSLRGQQVAPQFLEQLAARHQRVGVPGLGPAHAVGQQVRPEGRLLAPALRAEGHVGLTSLGGQRLADRRHVALFLDRLAARIQIGVAAPG